MDDKIMIDSGVIAMALWTAFSGGVIFVMKRWLDGNDEAKKQLFKTSQEFIIHKKSMEDRVSYLQTLVEKDISAMKEAVSGLAVSVKDLEVKLERRDDKLIDELKQALRDKR